MQLIRIQLLLYGVDIANKILRAGDKARISRFHTLRGDLIPIREILTLPVEIILRLVGIKRRGPWLCKNAIRELSEALKDGNKRVLEIGGGKSTSYFLQRASFLMTIEDDPIWASRIRLKTNANERQFEMLISSLDEWLPSRTKLNMDFDIVLIDGGSDTMRRKALEILPVLNPSAIYVLDNSDRQIFDRINFSIYPKKIVRHFGMVRHPFQATETTFYYF